MSLHSHPHTRGFGGVGEEGKKGAVIPCDEKSKDCRFLHTQTFLSSLIPLSSLNSHEWRSRRLKFRSCVCSSSKSCPTNEQNHCSSRRSCLPLLSALVFLLLIFLSPLLVSGLRISIQGSLRHCCRTPALESCLCSESSHLLQKTALFPRLSTASTLTTALHSFPRSFISLEKKLKSYFPNFSSRGVPQHFLHSDAFASIKDFSFPLSFSSFLRFHFLTSLVSLGSLSLNAWLSLNRIALLPTLPSSCLALFRLHSRLHETLRRHLSFQTTSHVAIQAIIIAPLLEELQFRWMIQKILLGGLLLTTTSFSKSPCCSTDTVTDTRVSHSSNSPLFLPLRQNKKAVSPNLTSSSHNAFDLHHDGRTPTPSSVDDKRCSRNPLKLRLPSHTGDSGCSGPIPTSDERGKEPSREESKESSLFSFPSVSQVTRIVLTSLLFGLAHYQVPDSYVANTKPNGVSSPLTPSFSSSSSSSSSSLKSSLRSHSTSKASESLSSRASPHYTPEKSSLLLPRHPSSENSSKLNSLSSPPGNTPARPSTDLSLFPFLSNPLLPVDHLAKAPPFRATSSLPSLFSYSVFSKSSLPSILTRGNEASSPSSFCRRSLDKDKSRSLSTKTSSPPSTMPRQENKERNLPAKLLLSPPSPSSLSVVECIGANRVISATAQALVWGLAMERGGLLTAISLHALHNAQQILILSIVKFLLRRMKITGQIS